MSGSILLEVAGPIALVSMSHPGKFNAMSKAMWRELATSFTAIQNDPDVRCVLMQGEGRNFCSGGDITEYADFRFEEKTLREFHEEYVWPGLQAMLDCDVPIVARIEGNCMGAGLEIASCCDVRIASDSVRFGAPIAKLGFPMAPREAALVTRAVGELTAREMLLTAALFDATEMKRRGFLNAVVAEQGVGAAAFACADRIASLAPRAARLNKQTLRTLMPLYSEDTVTKLSDSAYSYADAAEHHEGISAFLEKRTAQF